MNVYVSYNQNHTFTYNEKIKVESVMQAVCDPALYGETSEGDESIMISLVLFGCLRELDGNLWNTPILC